MRFRSLYNLSVKLSVLPDGFGYDMSSVTSMFRFAAKRPAILLLVGLIATAVTIWTRILIYGWGSPVELVQQDAPWTPPKECPYKLTLEPVTTERSNLSFDLTVENTSNQVVGWDSQFVAGIRFELTIRSRSFWANVTTVMAVDRNSNRLLPAEDFANASRRPDSDRFIELMPGQRAMHRFVITDEYREFGIRFPIGIGGRPLPPVGTEKDVRYRIPSWVKSVDVTARFRGYGANFRTCYEGVEPNEFKIWWDGNAESNTVKVDFP